MPESFDLDAVSLLLVWTAIVIYVLGFTAYVVDLARRSQLAVDRAPVAAQAELVGARVAGSAESVPAADAGVPAQPATGPPASSPRLVWARIGTSLTVLGLLFHVGADLTRGIAAGRVPWSNMYEFALTGTMLIIAVYLGVLVRIDLRFLGSFITGLVVVLLGGATLSFYREVVPLSDPLESVWLVVHVFVAALGTALFALAFGLSVLQLMQARRGGSNRAGWRFLQTIPNEAALESQAYRFTIIGFAFWTFTLIAGAIWANVAWGRYWAFDTKEVWTFIIWVLYAGYIHARATRGWRGNRSAWLGIVAFAAVIFNFVVVNVYFKGLHAYSGL